MLHGHHVYRRSDWHRPDWYDEAACRNHPHSEWWFPTNRRGTNEAAQQICAGCPVRLECLHHAVTHHEEDGIFGGVPAPDRRRHRIRLTIGGGW